MLFPIFRLSDCGNRNNLHKFWQPQEDPVKLNPNKILAAENSLIKISSKGNSSTHVFAKVAAFDKELKNHGLSMEYDMSKVFEFQSNEEVVVEVVQESSCEIHMVEVSIITILVTMAVMNLNIIII